MTHWEIVATFIITTELVKISKILQSDPAASAIINKYLQKFKLLKVIYHTYHAIPGNDQVASTTNQKTAGSKLERTS